MKLTVEQIKSVITGAAYVDEIDGKIHLHRFTKEQEELYRVTNADFYKKSHATSGIRLEFLTDSKTLGLSVEVFSGSSRNFFSHAIYVDGKPFAELGSEETNSGEFEGNWELPDGEKRVKIYFPWSTMSMVNAITLDDGATLVPVKKSCKMIMFGDSITHGYDAHKTQNSYASRLTDALDADCRNKGIGAEMFFPALAELKEDFDPDYITVAYGTNDWACRTREEFETNCKKFYETLSKNYPNAKIFALTPIWRQHYYVERNAGTFESAASFIESVAATLPNVTAINGFHFIPGEEKYFSPDVLHPNDDGFEHYFNNLYKELKKYI